MGSASSFIQAVRTLAELKMAALDLTSPSNVVPFKTPPWIRSKADSKFSLLICSFFSRAARMAASLQRFSRSAPENPFVTAAKWSRAFSSSSVGLNDVFL